MPAVGLGPMLPVTCWMEARRVAKIRKGLGDILRANMAIETAAAEEEGYPEVCTRTLNSK